MRARACARVAAVLARCVVRPAPWRDLLGGCGGCARDAPSRTCVARSEAKDLNERKARVVSDHEVLLAGVRLAFCPAATFR